MCGTASTCRALFSLRYLNVAHHIPLHRISSRGSYTNTGLPYDVTRIVNADATFNEEEYKNYSPLFLSTTFAISYGLSFASITATLTHALYVAMPLTCSKIFTLL